MLDWVEFRMFKTKFISFTFSKHKMIFLIDRTWDHKNEIKSVVIAD